MKYRDAINLASLFFVLNFVQKSLLIIFTLIEIMRTKVTIIGSGYSSMVAACCLAQQGVEVDVYEKNDAAGGRASYFESDGFSFDMGPSWYWMPEVFENFFNKFGKKASDYYDLVQLDPGYQVYFKEAEAVKIPASKNELLELFESIEEGSAKKLEQFLAEAEYKYRVGMDEYVWKPGRSITEFMDIKVLKSFTKLQMLSSVTKAVHSLFKDERLRQILEFPVLFLGSMPNRIPALYTLMNHADLSLGTWYPKGGMYKVSEAFYTLAVSLGVKFHFNTPIEGVEIKNKKIVALRSGNENIPVEFIINGSDYHHFDKEILPAAYSNYSDSYWDSREMAPSSLLFYLGIDKKISGLEHHNLFFDSDFETHASEIYETKEWPSDPLFYICAPSKTDKECAPSGCENLFALIPIAPGLEEDKNLHQRYLNEIIRRIKDKTGEDITNHIVYKKSFSISDFKSRYNAFKGNAYGLANTLKQTAVLKPKFYSKKLDNLYHTGQLTVPGPGMPPAIVSGQLVAEQFLERHKIKANGQLI